MGTFFTFGSVFTVEAVFPVFAGQTLRAFFSFGAVFTVFTVEAVFAIDTGGTGQALRALFALGADQRDAVRGPRSSGLRTVDFVGGGVDVEVTVGADHVRRGTGAVEDGVAVFAVLTGGAVFTRGTVFSGSPIFAVGAVFAGSTGFAFGTSCAGIAFGAAFSTDTKYTLLAGADDLDAFLTFFAFQALAVETHDALFRARGFDAEGQ